MERNKMNECDSCEHRRAIPGDAHIKCAYPDLKMKGHICGIKAGWFKYPHSYDPIWKEKDCDNYNKWRMNKGE